MSQNGHDACVGLLSLHVHTYNHLNTSFDDEDHPNVKTDYMILMLGKCNYKNIHQNEDIQIHVYDLPTNCGPKLTNFFKFQNISSMI